MCRQDWGSGGAHPWGSRGLMSRWQHWDAIEQFHCSPEPLLFITSENASELPFKLSLKGALRPHASMASDHCHFFLIFLFPLLASPLWEQQVPVSRTTPCMWCFGVCLCPDSWLCGWENPQISALCFRLRTPPLCLPMWHAFSAFPDVTLLSVKQNSKYPLYSYTFTKMITEHLL